MQTNAIKAQDSVAANVLFANIAECGVHIWEFKAISIGAVDLIGIEMVRAEAPKFYGYNNHWEKKLSGLVVGDALKGDAKDMICVQHSPGLQVQKNDIILMKLDCINWSLSFKSSKSGDYLLVFDEIEIKPGKYSASLRLGYFGESAYQLLKYNMIY